MPRMPEPVAAQVLGVLGAAAIIFGSVVALRQARLKLLIAYSTVAQIGYLFLMFPLAIRPETGHPWSTTAWTGGLLQAISHAFAKAAMFLAAGLIAEELGHDQVARLGGIGRALPITVFAFGLGGLSPMGLPPSGGFIAKAMLLTAAVAEGQWWWAVVVLIGGLLAGGHVFVVLARALTDPIKPLRLSTTVSVKKSARTTPPPDAAARRRALPVLTYSVEQLPSFDAAFYNGARAEVSKVAELTAPREARAFEISAGHLSAL